MPDPSSGRTERTKIIHEVDELHPPRMRTIHWEKKRPWLFAGICNLRNGNRSSYPRKQAEAKPTDDLLNPKFSLFNSITHISRTGAPQNYIQFAHSFNQFVSIPALVFIDCLCLRERSFIRSVAVPFRAPEQILIVAVSVPGFEKKESGRKERDGVLDGRCWHGRRVRIVAFEQPFCIRLAIECSC